MEKTRFSNKKDKRENDELERLEKENRQLKAINRSLTKQLKKLAKGIHRQDALEILEKLEEEPSNAQKEDPKRDQRGCPSCGRLGLREIIVAGRRFERCEICDYKSGRLK